MTDSNEVSCPSCDSKNVKSHIVDTTFFYGNGESAVELSVKLQALTCLACGLEYVDDTAEDLKHEAVCRHLGVFTPAEIETIRNSLGMTRSKFAELTRIGEATLGRWERGALIQNSSHDQFLYLLQFPDNVVRLLNRKSSQDSADLHISMNSKQEDERFRGLAKSNTIEPAKKKAESFRLRSSEAA